MQIPLTAQEEARLTRLQEQLPSRVPSVDDRDPFTLLTTPLPVNFTQAGKFGSGTLRNASAGGLAVATVELPPELGQRVIVHVQETLHGLEYSFPCRVISRVVKGVMAMGLVFEGVPSQARIDGKRSGVWRADQDLTPVDPHITHDSVGNRRSRGQ